MENVLKQSDGVFTNPPLSHSYSMLLYHVVPTYHVTLYLYIDIDVKSHGMADGPVDTEMS